MVDPGRNRIWQVDDWQYNFNSVEYVQLPEWTVAEAPQGGYTPTGIDVYKSLFIHQGLLFLQTNNGKLWVFDPDHSTANWRLCKVSGGLLPADARNQFVFFPPTGKFYWLNKTGGATLYRLTPPQDLISGTWLLDTITVSQPLPRKWSYNGTNPTAHETEHYRMLTYVPSLQRLAWMTDIGVYLIHPT